MSKIDQYGFHFLEDRDRTELDDSYEIPKEEFENLLVANMLAALEYRNFDEFWAEQK